MVQNANYLICLFMNMNDDIRNKNKIRKKWKAIPTKTPKSQLTTVLDNQIWNQINAKA